MENDIDVVVVGAGAVGLAIARQFARTGRQVIVLERNSAIGQETSSRNSEVIHAGIYYPSQSLKAKLCVRGKELLYKFCQAYSVEFNRCGKLIVASNPDQIQHLQALFQQAFGNGVTDLSFLSKQELNEMELEVRAETALFSPSTGIVDSHGFMLALQADLERYDGTVLCDSTVTRADIDKDGIRFVVNTNGDESELKTTVLINSAGLGACDFARRIDGLPPKAIPEFYLARGNYFCYSGPAHFKHLVYPVPEQAGLGIHATLDLAGNMRFGPDVEWTDSINYDVNEDKLDGFYEAILNYWPAAERNRLYPGYVGIRPKLSGPGSPSRDFQIQGPGDHGCPGLVNLFGIESPGLTAALAIGEYVEELTLQCWQ
jgi:L-2-hydroxyglutarate oxidase LhgO